MGVDVLAFPGVLNHAAYIHAVLDRRIAFGKIRKGDFVSDGNVVVCGDREVTVVLGDDGEQLRACLYPFDHYYTDIVTPVMNQ